MMNQEGYIYLMSNPSLKKGIYKIGFTYHKPEKRAQGLSKSTSIPSDFNVEYARKTTNIEVAEKRVHLVLDSYRYSSKKEFFIIPRKHALEMIDKVVQNDELNYSFGNMYNKSNDLPDAEYSKKLPLKAMIILDILMCTAQKSTITDRLINQIIKENHFISGFIGHVYIMEQLQISKEHSQRILRNFVRIYQDLEYRLPNRRNFEKVFDFIKYNRGELGWKFTANFSELFYNETYPKYIN